MAIDGRWLRTRSYVFRAAALSAIVFSFNHANAQSMAAADSPPPDELAALKSENVKLRSLIPSQSHAMMDVSFHFTNLWFAGQEKNWPLAQFYLNETRSHIKWSLRLVPVRKTTHGELKLQDKFDPFDADRLAEIQKQITAQDRKLFSVAYRDAMSGCNECHAAADKPYLLVVVPDKATAQGIQFKPNK